MKLQTVMPTFKHSVSSPKSKSVSYPRRKSQRDRSSCWKPSAGMYMLELIRCVAFAIFAAMRSKTIPYTKNQQVHWVSTHIECNYMGYMLAIFKELLASCTQRVFWCHSCSWNHTPFPAWPCSIHAVEYRHTYKSINICELDEHIYDSVTFNGWMTLPYRCASTDLKLDWLEQSEGLPSW